MDGYSTRCSDKRGNRPFFDRERLCCAPRALRGHVGAGGLRFILSGKPRA
jgi:hypothetical protein